MRRKCTDPLSCDGRRCVREARDRAIGATVEVNEPLRAVDEEAGVRRERGAAGATSMDERPPSHDRRAEEERRVAAEEEGAFVVERRARRKGDRRQDHERARNYPPTLDRRRGPGRRLSDFARAAEEGELTPEQFLFVTTLHRFKQANDRTFPSWTEVLEVVRLLGYRKVQKSLIDLRGAEDFTEPADAPANVRLNEPTRDQRGGQAA